MDYKIVFPSISTDLFGYVSPWVLFQSINDFLAREMDLDGAGVERLLKEVGATWMLGQLLVEYDAPVRHSVPLEVRFHRRKSSGACSVRRMSVLDGGKELVRYTEKFLPVAFAERKVLPLSALDHLWQRPGGEMEESFGWIRLPAEMDLAEQVKVRNWWCDPNGHMTTYQYINLVCELAGYWDAGVRVLERLQMDFRGEFVPGERMSLYRAEENGVTYVSGMHDDGRLGFAASVKLSETSYPYARFRAEDLI